MLGGEGNGGVIDPRVGLVRDSFVGMADDSRRHGRRGKLNVSQLAAELPRYEIVKTKLTLPREQIAAALDAVERHFRRRPGRSARRPAARLARQMAAGAGQQHRADRAGDRRGAQPGRSRTTCAAKPRPR